MRGRATRAIPFSAISALLHMEGSNGSTTFTDNSLNALVITANSGADQSNAQSKWGTTSGRFLNGGSNNAYLTFGSTSWLAFGTGDYTVECWLYLTGNGFDIITGNDGAGTAYFNMFADTARKVVVAKGPSGGDILIQGTTVLSTGQWYHLAASRLGTTVRLFINGALEGSATDANSYAASAIRLGYTATSGIHLAAGYMNDFRVTKGYSQYNSAFTAPTARFPNS